MNTMRTAPGTTTLSIDGLSCGHCVQAVTKALSAVPGVTVRSVAVGAAEIETKDGRAAGQAVAALEAAGDAGRIAAGVAGDGSGAPKPRARALRPHKPPPLTERSLAGTHVGQKSHTGSPQ